VYASNRYDKEFVRVPQNYAGNAFSMPPPKAAVEQEAIVAASESLPAEPSAQPEPGQPLPTAAEEDGNVSTGMPQPLADAQEHTPPQGELPAQKGDGAWEWLTRLGIGQEELLLVGLLLLMRGEQSQDITWLLLLLLALR
jgi:hypothetical protein